MTGDRRRDSRHGLRAARKAAGMSVAVLAAKLKVDAATLADWEDGHYWPLPEVEERWRDAVGR